MNFLKTVAQLPWTEPLGWTLIHFLWQGAALGIAAWLALRLAHRAGPNTRYLIGCLAMLACVLAPAITFAVLSRSFERPAAKARLLTNAGEPARGPSPSLAPSPVFRHPAAIAGVPQAAQTPAKLPAPDKTPLLKKLAEQAALGSVPVWFCGVLTLGLRLLFGWHRIQRWKRHSKAAAPGWLAESFDRLARKMQVPERTRLLLSVEIPGPLTLGVLKPVVLLPAALLTGISRGHLEAILAHELAHILRHDYFVNLLQSAVEVVLFYHPAIWWLGRQLRQAREECCDELAAAICGDRVGYGKALLALEEFRSAKLAMNDSGGSLLHRIQRLFGRQEPEAMLCGRNAGCLAAIATALTTALCLLYSGTLTAGEEPPATVKPPPAGLVVDAEGKPAAGVRVWIYHSASYWGLGNSNAEETRTDRQGRFAFRQPLHFKVAAASDSAEHYFLLATAPGKAPAWFKIVATSPLPAEPEGYRLVLTRPKSQSYEVVDEAGRPVPGAAVWLRYAGKQQDRKPLFDDAFLSATDSGLASAVTDEQGRATLPDLPDTPYNIAASKAGYEDCTDCTTPRDGAPRFVLKTGATLKGRVTDPLGLPVSGAVIALYPKFGWHQYFLARSDKAGRFKIEKIWSHGDRPNWGTYSVSTKHPRFTSGEQTIHFGPGEAKTGYEIAAVPGTKIVGTLLDPVSQRLVAGTQVTIDSKSGRQSSWTDKEGKFTARVVPSTITAFASMPPTGFYFVEGYTGFNSSVQMEASGNELPLTVYLGGGLKPLKPMGGTVILPNGKPAAYCKIKAFFPGRRRLNLGNWSGDIIGGFYTGENGRFEIPEFPAGEPGGWYAETGDGKFAAVIHSSSGVLAADPVLRLQPTTTGTLPVTDREGKPLRKQTITVSPLFDGVEIWTNRRELKPDKDGFLNVSGILPGEKCRITSGGGQGMTQEVVIAPPDPATHPSPLSFTDRFLVRLENMEGTPLKIESFKDFHVWILSEGKRVQWTNGPLPILERRSESEVSVSREVLGLGKPGDKVDFMIETEGGAVVPASGLFPENSSGLIAAKATAPVPKPDTVADPGIPDIAPGEVAGRVLDPAGKPVEGAIIDWNPYATIQKAPPITTDAGGIFRLPAAAANRPCITVLKEGFAPFWITDFPAGAGFQLKLQNATRFKGRFLDSHGNPAGSMHLKLETDKPTRRERLRFKVEGIQYAPESNEAGEYDFPIAPGRYRIQAVSKKGEFFRGELAIGENEVKPLPERLRPGFGVTLKTVDCQTGKAIPGIAISIRENLGPYSIGVRPGSERTTDKDGLARWENLLPGPTRFEAQRRFPFGRIVPNQNAYILWWLQTPNQASGPGARNGIFDLTLEVKEGMGEIVIQMERGTEINGKVVNEKGDPIPDVLVDTVPNHGMRSSLTGDMRFTLRTGPDGAFHGFIPAGNGTPYNLSAYLTPPQGGETPYANAISEPFQSQPGDRLDFRLQMSRGGWVTGRVVDSAKKPRAGVEVQASAKDRQDSVYADKRTASDTEGKFRLGPLRAGAYEVRPRMEGGTGLSGQEPVTVEVKEGIDTPAGDLVLPK